MRRCYARRGVIATRRRPLAPASWRWAPFCCVGVARADHLASGCTPTEPSAGSAVWGNANVFRTCAGAAGAPCRSLGPRSPFERARHPLTERDHGLSEDPGLCSGCDGVRLDAGCSHLAAGPTFSASSGARTFGRTPVGWKSAGRCPIDGRGGPRSSFPRIRPDVIQGLVR